MVWRWTPKQLRRTDPCISSGGGAPLLHDLPARLLLPSVLGSSSAPPLSWFLGSLLCYCCTSHCFSIFSLSSRRSLRRFSLSPDFTPADMDLPESRRERSEERYRNDDPMREPLQGAFDGPDKDDRQKSRESSKHRSKDRKKSRREERDHKSSDRDHSKANDDFREREREAKDLEKERTSSRGKKKEEKEDHEKDRSKEKVRGKDYDKDKYSEKDNGKRDRKDSGKERDPERGREIERDIDRGREKERGKEKGRERDKEREREKAKDKYREKDREREKDKEKHRDQDRGREYEKDRGRELERESGKEKMREKEREDKEKPRDRDKGSRANRDDIHSQSKDGGKEDKIRVDREDGKDGCDAKQENASPSEEDGMIVEQEKYAEGTSGGSNQDLGEIEERILKMKEERVKKKSEGVSEILAWVDRSRKLEGKRNVEKEKAQHWSKILAEQDNIDEQESEDETIGQQTTNALSGVKILHGLDKVLVGGSVVLTLKDQEILANGDINEDVDMLENVEIGEQKQRDEAYKAAKKKTGIYDDKFNDDLGSEKKILPQYDDPSADEGVTLDARGRFTGEAEKKLEELRRRIQGTSGTNQIEDLNSSVKIASDYYTQEEMLHFKKTKKKKSLRKKEKLDIDALEAEAVSAGLGFGDLGSRNDGKRQIAREEQERSEAERRINAYRAAYAKADDASRALRMEQAVTIQTEEVDAPVFSDDAEDLQKSLERTRKLALKKQNEKATSGPEAIARLASSTISSEPPDSQNPGFGESLENKVVFTEMEEFVWGLQLDEEAPRPGSEDVFMEEDEAPKASEEEAKDEGGGWTEVKESDRDEQPRDKDEEEVVPDETIHEAPVGKGLSGALRLLKERGSLKETVEWGGRNMDKKKSKLVGIYEDGAKEIRIERTDEYGRILTPKEAFRLLSHKFHGKGPGKMKQEKRMKQYQDELKLKQMKNADTPSQSVERMREAQARMQTPYLVLSGHVKPGQTSDPRSGFATVEKDLPGGLTPMLGDKKVEHFLGIKRKAEPGNSGAPKKQKT
ncbi:hypothetical protein Nepgr_033358 [Nepenthes gracilis]|uniref:SART-1 family protein DOT2 n=1 Tax=Nepenthes gracilis TaxID=150966 RepID=A0AAD3Y8B2_NEPGR|nr:hypothetical protein Nepgr_033358 [Nepenthes gracilis]